MRKLASVVEIASCEPIENTDRLSVATMKGKGWRVVTGRDEYKVGDKAVYFEIDSALPSDDPRYEFLRERCLRKFVSKSGQILKMVIRIKTVKLRGVISQGLLIGLSKYPELSNANVGDDVTEVLEVEHYDEIAEALRPATGGGSALSADAMGKFPSDFIPKTDEERIQNLAEYFTTMKGRKFEVTEKNDGSSVTMFFSTTVDAESPFGVCSRNLRLKPQTAKGEIPLAWKMAHKYEIETKIAIANATLNTDLAFQGELVGPEVNGNRDLYTDWEWHVFKVYDIKAQRYLLPDVARQICSDVGLTYVPVIAEAKAVFDEFSAMDELLKFAEGKTGRGHEREGLVFKSCDYPYVSFKAVSNRYLLKQEA